MNLSKTELQILAQMAVGNKKINEIAAALNKSLSQIYRSGQKLVRKGWIIPSRREYWPVKNTLGSLLLQNLRDFPSLIEPFSDAGMLILSQLTEPKNVQELKDTLKISRTQIFKKIKQAKAVGLIKNEQGKYILNDKIWGKAVYFLRELKAYEENVDSRVPLNSTIYYKTKNEIIFSSPEELDATPTAFSAYESCGIKIISPIRYYFLPLKKLSKEEVFIHSLYIAEKEKETRNLIYITLFYLKHKKALRTVKHPLIKELKLMLEGRQIPGYPSLKEIREKAEIYDTKL